MENKNNKSALERFRVESPAKKCSICDKTIEQYFAVSIKSTDPIHTYKNSGKPYVTVYKFLLCEDHYLLFKGMLEKFSKESNVIFGKEEEIKIGRVEDQFEKKDINKEIDDILKEDFAD